MLRPSLSTCRQTLPQTGNLTPMGHQPALLMYHFHVRRWRSCAASSCHLVQVDGLKCCSFPVKETSQSLDGDIQPHSSALINGDLGVEKVFLWQWMGLRYNLSGFITYAGYSHRDESEVGMRWGREQKEVTAVEREVVWVCRSAETFQLISCFNRHRCSLRL